MRITFAAKITTEINIMVTIIFAHPCHGSFNKAILDAITAVFDKSNQIYTVLDLNKDKFNPVISEEDMMLYYQGKSTDPLISHYQSVLKKSEKVIFVFPIWWGTVPAILKGFLDKVFLVNFSHTYENCWTPLLNIEKTVVITTSQAPSDAFVSSIENNFVKECLGMVGLKNAIWLNCDNVGFETNEYRNRFIQRVESIV